MRRGPLGLLQRDGLIARDVAKKGTREIPIYTKSGTDANAAATFTASNVYTVPAGGLKVVDVLLVNGSVAVTADALNYAEIDVISTGLAASIGTIVTDLTANGGTGNIAAGETVSFKDRSGGFNTYPVTLAAADTLSVDQLKNNLGVTLGSYTLYLVVQ